MAKEKLMVTPPPHLRSGETIASSMRDVVVALIPAVIAALVVFKVNALFNIVLCVATAVAAEWLTRKALKRSNTIDDWSAVLTGLLVALVMPATAPWLHYVIAVLVAIVVIKELVGGLGLNIFNPALFGFAFVLICSGILVPWTSKLGTFPGLFDGATGGTPLTFLKHGLEGSASAPSLLALLFGNRTGGSLAEVGAFWVLLGGAYLLYKGIIRWVIPISIIATVLILTYILGADGVYAILAGGVMLGAFFMATDWVTSPMTPYGQAAFGILIGVLVVLIRLYGAPSGAVAYSILIGNAFVPLLDRLFKPERFGAVAAA